jgi:hypothetical protein
MAVLVKYDGSSVPRLHLVELLVDLAIVLVVLSVGQSPGFGRC